MAWHKDPAAFPWGKWPVGTKVQFVEDVERYPHFTIPAGVTGVVVHGTNEGIGVRVDQVVEGLTDNAEWEGVFLWDAGTWDDEAHDEPPWARTDGDGELVAPVLWFVTAKHDGIGAQPIYRHVVLATSEDDAIGKVRRHRGDAQELKAFLHGREIVSLGPVSLARVAS
jgi:hypothetical protein